MRKTCKKVLSLLLAAAIAVIGLRGALPITMAYAAGSAGTANDGIDFGALTGNGIYYGTYDHATSIQNNNDSQGDVVTSREGRAAPILWNVMGEEGTDGNLTMLSKYVLDTKQFYFSSGYSGANAYNRSVIRDFLTGNFMNSFIPGEQAGMASTTQVVTGMYDYNTGTELTGTLSYQIDPFPLTTNDKVYLPWGRHYDGKIYWTAGNDIGGGEILDKTATLKSGTGASWRLRSPDSRAVVYAANTSLIVDSSGNINGDNVYPAFGVRPVSKLDPSSIVFLSEIVLSGGDGMGKIDADVNYAAGGGTKNYKLTILNNNLMLNSLNAPGGAPLAASGETLTIAPGGSLALTGAIGGGAEKLAYKIVDRVGDEIVGYGAGNAANLSVASSTLAQGGSYTLYVWAQKDNEKNSNEASQPMHFTLNVQQPTAPTITGPTNMTLDEGYTATSTGAYTVTGTTPIMVTPSDTRFTWDTVNKKLNIPAGLAAGSYTVMLTASNGTSADATLTFTLTVRPAPTPAYTLTVENGFDSTGGGQYTAGTQVSITANIAPAGTAFAYWSSSNGGTFANINSATTTFTMPANNVIITANYKNGTPDPNPEYIFRTLTDSATGVTVSGLIHKRAALTVGSMALGHDFACEAIRKRMADNGSILLIGKNISLSHGFSGSLTVTIPLPTGYSGEVATVLNCANGTLNTYTATVTNGKAVFRVGSLSSFAVLQSGITTPDTMITDPPKTGDAARSAGFIMLALSALFIAVAVKRRKA